MHCEKVRTSDKTFVCLKMLSRLVWLQGNQVFVKKKCLTDSKLCGRHTYRTVSLYVEGDQTFYR
jgi:hypothetical protein